MWIAYAKDGTKYTEELHRWIDVRDKDICKLESHIGGQQIIVEIPENTLPIMFNTGETLISGNTQNNRQISQAIGYSDGGSEYYTRIFTNGVIQEETGPVIH